MSYAPETASDAAPPVSSPAQAVSPSPVDPPPAAPPPLRAVPDPEPVAASAPGAPASGGEHGPPVRHAEPPRRTIPPEALEFLPDALMIEERPLPFTARLTLYVLLTMVVTAVAWAWATEVDRIVTARGRLVTTPSTIVVQPLETSIIQSLDVVVGDQVQKGQILAALDPTFARADLAQMTLRLRAADALIARLEAEVAGQPYFPATLSDPDQVLQSGLWRQRQAQFRARMDSLSEAVSRRKAAIVTNTQDQLVLQERFSGLLAIERMRAELARNMHESRLKLLESADARLEVGRDLEMSLNRAAELVHDLANAEAEQVAFVEEWRQKVLEERVQAQRERDQVAQQIDKLAKRAELVSLVSPVEGIVQEVARKSAGSVIREAEPLITLVPLDTPIEAEVRVEARDIGNIRVNDSVRLKIDAFPFQKHGTLSGTVRAISQDAFSRENSMGLSQAPGDQGAEAYYVVRVAFEGMTLHHVPENTRLIPGMTLSGEIVVGKRDVLSYFIYPVVRVFDESIREP